MKNKLEKLKNSKLGFTSFIISISLLLISIYACNKNTESQSDCIKCNQRQQTKSLIVNEQAYLVNSYASNLQQFNVTALNQVDMPKIASDGLFAILGTLGIQVPSTIANTEPYGIALFYDTLLAGDINNNFPISYIVYYKDQETQRTYAGFWKKDNESNLFAFIPNLSGINNMISPTNFAQLNKIVYIPNGIELKEVLVLIDENKLPNKIYRTVFQIKLENELRNPISTDRPTSGGEQPSGPVCDWCNAPMVEGYCGMSGDCSTGKICPTNEAGMVMNDPFTDEERNYLYWLRDSVLMKTTEGQKIIDDYYYSGEIMRGNISISLALKLRSLFGINLFEKFPRFYTATNREYDNEVLLDEATHEILSEMCNEASQINIDARFQSIIQKVQLDANKYKNKPFSVIRNDF